MIKLELQYFGGRGASYKIKGENVLAAAKIAKSEEQTLKDIASKYVSDHAEYVYTDDKERELNNELIKTIRNQTGMGSYSAEKAAMRIRNQARDPYEGKTYYKDENGNIQDIQLEGNTNFNLVRKNGGKATAFITLNKERGVTEVKPVEAHIYNIDGRDFAVHKPYGETDKRAGWVVSDVATGLRIGNGGSTREKAVETINSGIVSQIKQMKLDDRRTIQTAKLVQRKLQEENNRKKR